MKTQTLIASIAALLLTGATLGTVNYNVPVVQAVATEINGIRVTDLQPVTVYPLAEDLRSAALLTEVGAVGLVTLPLPGNAASKSGAQPLSLISPPLAMPYYSYAKNLGRISKE